jgi:hypothetical protein
MDRAGAGAALQPRRVQLLPRGAARPGARLVWPSERQHGLRDAALPDILAELLPTADEGLRQLGVSQVERDRYLGVIDARLAGRRNPAAWQRDCQRARMSRGTGKVPALGQMLERYIEHSTANHARRRVAPMTGSTPLPGAVPGVDPWEAHAPFSFSA